MSTPLPNDGTVIFTFAIDSVSDAMTGGNGMLGEGNFLSKKTWHEGMFVMMHATL